MKHFIRSIIALIIVLSLTACGIAVAINEPYEISSFTYDDLDLLLELMEAETKNKEVAHEMANNARYLGFPEDHVIIRTASSVWFSSDDKYKEYKEIYDTLVEKWNQKEEEYPTATYVWTYLKNLGYSNEVCAGILGNMMNEVGGNTLSLKYDAYGSGYYGLCQWSKTYYYEIWGASLEDQCNYLRDTIKYEINTFGYAYQKGFGYDSFLEMTDVRQIALAFAKAYERCGSGSYSARQNNAVTAYNYFVN